MMGIQILIRLVQSGSLQELWQFAERSLMLAVECASELIRVVANPPDLRSLILYQYCRLRRYSTITKERIYETADFKTEKRVRGP
jgi:hypothetical protein